MALTTWLPMATWGAFGGASVLHNTNAAHHCKFGGLTPPMGVCHNTNVGWMSQSTNQHGNCPWGDHTMTNTPSNLMGVNPIYAPNVTLPPNVLDLCKSESDVRFAKLIMVVGMGFHPDDDMGEYVANGKPFFTPEQAEAANADIDLYDGDPSEFSMDVEVALGLIPAWR
jgi:hypothetical protein